MPIYEFDLSDGTTVTVEADTEPTDEQVLGALQSFQEPEAPSFAPSLPQEQIVQKYFDAPTTAPVQAPPPLFDESMRQVPMRTTTGTAPTPMMAYDLPPEERRAQFKEDILTPAVPLPRLTIDPKESPVTAAGKEAVNVLIGVPEFVETPAGILSFGAAAIAPIVTAGGFTVDMLYNLGKQIKTAYGNWDKMTPAEKTVAVVDMAGTGAFAALTGTAAGLGVKRRLEPRPIEKVKLESRGDVINRMEEELRTSRQAQEGSPFVRIQPPSDVVSMGMRTQPPLSPATELGFQPTETPIPMPGTRQPTAVSIPETWRPTFDPSGLGVAGRGALPIPPEVGRLQPPSPTIAPPTPSGRAAQIVRLKGEAAQRMADWEKSMAE